MLKNESTLCVIQRIIGVIIVTNIVGGIGSSMGVLGLTSETVEKLPFYYSIFLKPLMELGTSEKVFFQQSPLTIILGGCAGWVLGPWLCRTIWNLIGDLLFGKK